MFHAGVGAGIHTTPAYSFIAFRTVVMTQDANSSGFDALAERLIREHWNFYPTTGSRIGRHEYDGLLPDLSPSQVSRRQQEIRRGAAELRALDPSTLGPDGQLSYRMLELFLERELFTFEEMRPLENNPMRQAGFLNMGGYVRRDYAPLEDRLRAATAALRQVPDFLDTVDAALREDLSRHMVDMSVESYEGMAHFYLTDLAAFASAVDDREISVAFTTALDTAAAALDGFVQRLKSRGQGSDGDFAIGSKLYSRMLATGEGLDLSLERITAVGQANLDENLSLIREVAASIAHGKTVREIVDENSLHHPFGRFTDSRYAGDAGRHPAVAERLRYHLPAFGRPLPGGGNPGLYALCLRSNGQRRSAGN